MNLTEILKIVLFVLIGWYIYQLAVPKNVTEGFRKKKKGLGKSLKKLAKRASKGVSKATKSVTGKKKSRSRSKSSSGACSDVDVLNFAILQIIANATDQATVADITTTYSSGLKTYMEDALRTNLRLTNAGAALSEEEFQAKANELINLISTSKSQTEFTNWFNTFTGVSAPTDSTIEGDAAASEGSVTEGGEASTEASE